MLEDGEMGCTKVAKHKIEVTDPRPSKERLRNIPSGLLDEVKEHLDHMLDMGAIKPSKSAWSNAVVLVHKKDGGLRFCIDFQKLNAQTRKVAFLLPQIHDDIDVLSGSKYYTTINLFQDSGKHPWRSLQSNTPLLLLVLHSPYFLLATDCALLSFVVYYCCFGCSGDGAITLGNVVRVYPGTVQGLTFYLDEIYITKILACV